MQPRNGNTPGGPWIVGARWDAAVCFSTLWFPLALWMLWQGSARVGLDASETTLVAFTVLLNVPHFLTTLTFTYLDPGQRAHYRRHPVAFYVIPALLVVGPWVYSVSMGPLLFVTLWTLFGEHHVAAQNIGFTALYRARNGEGEADRRIDHRLFHVAWITTVFVYGTRPADATGLQYFSRPAYALPLEHYGLFVGCLGALAGLTLLAFVWRQAVRYRRGLPVSGPKILFVLTAWPSFILVPLFVDDAALLMVLRSGYHAVQYWALVRLVNHRRAEASGGRPRGAALAWLLERSAVTYWALHVIPAFAIWWVSEVYAGWPGIGSDWALQYLFFPGIALAHFFLDGLVWRMSDPHARRSVFAHLSPLRASPEPHVVA